MQYYFQHNNQQIGPYSLEQLHQQNIKPDTQVWREGMVNWQSAQTVPELATLFVKPNLPTNVPQGANTRTLLKVVITLLILISIGLGAFFFVIVPYIQERNRLASEVITDYAPKHEKKEEEALKKEKAEIAVPKVEEPLPEKEKPAEYKPEKRKPSIPNNCIGRFVSKNYYGNGHDEYLFLIGGQQTYYVYYDTQKQSYITLQPVEILEPSQGYTTGMSVYFPGIPDKIYRIYQAVAGYLAIWDYNDKSQVYQPY